ncbi:hypothetical protein CIPAW_02G162400 [Carya illinoinensis]|uniref:Uncharacterized protein n=1 Tax=Carya illinoinensis TaxID=32201 RepID=A0A8T1RHC3_CARIL|nr:hypothetical protein CIPAW_02G162400 [Carya illinoinensis]
MIILLNSSKCSEIGVPSFILSMYNRCFKYKRLVSDFFIYKLSSLDQRPKAVSSSATSLKTPSDSDNKMTLCAFSSSSLDDAGESSDTFPSKTFDKPCCRNKAFILMRHKLKLF